MIEHTRTALNLLKRELRADGLARFLHFESLRDSDYTRDRNEWQKDLTLEQLLESIRVRGDRSRRDATCSRARGRGVAGSLLPSAGWEPADSRSDTFTLLSPLFP
jgi:hypothetical protein